MFEKRERKNERARHRRRGVSRGMHSRDSPPSKCMHERTARRRLDIQGGGRGWVASPDFHLPSRRPGRAREPPIF